MFKVNDKVYFVGKDKHGVVVEVCHGAEYPVTVEFGPGERETFMEDGRFKTNWVQVLFPSDWDVKVVINEPRRDYILEHNEDKSRRVEWKKTYSEATKIAEQCGFRIVGQSEPYV